MHDQLASGARRLNCVMSVHLNPLFVFASVPMCVHTCAHWPESSLLIHTKNVCTWVHASVHTCAHILCVHEQWRLWLVSACVHTCMGVFDGNCNNQQYLMCYPILVSMRITPNWWCISFEFGSGRFKRYSCIGVVYVGFGHWIYNIWSNLTQKRVWWLFLKMKLNTKLGCQTL